MAVKLRLPYNNEGELVIGKWCMEMEDIWDVLSTNLLKLWKIVTFSSSRWGGVGAPCRMCFAGLLTGLEGFVHWLIKGKLTTGLWYLNGFLRLTTDLKPFALVAGLSAYVPEGIINHVYKEPALGRVVDAVRQEAVDNVALVQDISLAAWEMLGKACDWDAGMAMHNTIKAAHTSLGFVEWRALSVAG